MTECLQLHVCLFNRLHVRILYAAIIARRANKIVYKYRKRESTIDTMHIQSYTLYAVSIEYLPLIQTQPVQKKKKQKSHAMATWAYLGWTVNAAPCWLTPTSLSDSDWTPLEITVTHKSHTIKLCISLTLLCSGRKFLIDQNLNILSIFGQRERNDSHEWSEKKMMSPFSKNTRLDHLFDFREKLKKTTKHLTLWIKMQAHGMWMKWNEVISFPFFLWTFEFDWINPSWWLKMMEQTWNSAWFGWA